MRRRVRWHAHTHKAPPNTKRGQIAGDLSRGAKKMSSVCVFFGRNNMSGPQRVSESWVRGIVCAFVPRGEYAKHGHYNLQKCQEVWLRYPADPRGKSNACCSAWNRGRLHRRSLALDEHTCGIVSNAFPCGKCASLVQRLPPERPVPDLEKPGFLVPKCGERLTMLQYCVSRKECFGCCRTRNGTQWG